MTEAQRPVQSGEVTITAGEVTLSGDLVIAQASCGLVVFVHGSGSSRFSSRNRYIAGVLNDGGLATLLFEEPGTLEQVASLARDWFRDYLGAGST